VDGWLDAKGTGSPPAIDEAVIRVEVDVAENKVIRRHEIISIFIVVVFGSFVR
jgi:hypothetical protein